MNQFTSLEQLTLKLNSFRLSYSKGPKLSLKKENWNQVQALLPHKNLKTLELDYKDFKFTKISSLDNLKNSFKQNPNILNLKLNLYNEECLTDETFAPIIEEILKL